MKRIAIFCDGTWNRMSAEYPTNVLTAAQAVRPLAEDGVAQIVYYDEGVGTSFLINEWLETRLAGAFGLGVFGKIAAAYRFLIFNYEPGDEIFIFGFSRGAFTARSLAGLIRKCGIIPRAGSRNIEEAFKFYKRRDVHPDDEEAQKFRRRNAPHVIVKEEDRAWRITNGEKPDVVAAIKPLVLRYIGVWDTVGALGVPRHLLFSRLTNGIRKYEFHDLKLSSTVHSARHAVAVDESRLSFRPTLWRNLPALNRMRGDGSDYQQLWFPGNHGSVGGGGEIAGLSSNALIWVLDGAEKQGLQFDGTMLNIERTKIEHFAPLDNQRKKPGLLDRIYRRRRRSGPRYRRNLADSTIARLDRPESPAIEPDIAAWPAYRPAGLKAVWPPKP